jgi:PAT family beta-lactamase induction signal transducer AmpG
MTATDSKITWHSFLNPRIVVLLFQGFSSGLPLFLLLNLTQAWLAKSGLNVKTIGLFALMLMPYTWKFLWSPLMDRYAIPKLGRRRGWMAITQLLLFLLIGGLGMLDPHTQVPLIAGMTSLLAFASASQDVVLDAFRREILLDQEQGLGAAVFVNAYKFAALIPSSISLMLADHLPWQPVFWITGAFMLPGFICTLLIKEPTVYGEPPKNLIDAVVLPFKEFFVRSGWGNALWILAFILLYKMGDSLAVALSTKFYIDQGFTLTQIGAVGKLAGFWASIAGGIVGGIWMVKLGINRGLWVFGVMQALGVLAFALLAKSGADPYLLAFAVGTDYFVDAGLGTTAFVAFLSRSSDQRYTATQYALFSSLAAVPRTFLNSAAGYIVAGTGWFNFFILCFALAIPGLLLLPKIAPWNERDK